MKVLIKSKVVYFELVYDFFRFELITLLVSESYSQKLEESYLQIKAFLSSYPGISRRKVNARIEFF